MVASGDEWRVLSSTTSYAAPTRTPDLSREQLDNVLDMLDGRYPSEQFGELRPRIVWDRWRTRSARAGGRASSRSRTPARSGPRDVRRPPSGRPARRRARQEMVYEARPGQTFMLGASTWRIEDITRDRVIVTPAPGAPGAMPFWQGDGVGGRWSSAGRSASSPARRSTVSRPSIAESHDLDQRAARNLVRSCASSARRRASCRPTARSWSSASATRSATGGCACCRRTAAGCTPPGRSALGARFATARARGRRHLVGRRHRRPPPRRGRAAGRRPGAGRPGRARGAGGARAGVLGAVRRPLPRERRARAPDPARVPGQAHAALAAAAQGAVAARGGEALRPVPDRARDLPRVPARRARPAGAHRAAAPLHRRELSLVEVETQRASPFASSLLFDYVATYMYEGDTPNAERRAAALSLDRDLLRELLGQEELRELIDPEALAEVEADLQRTSERTRAANTDGLHDVLRAVGDLTAAEAQARSLEAVSATRMLAELEAERRAVRMRIGGEERWVAAEDAGLYRDALGAVPPGGLPAAFLEPVEDPLRRLIRRYARTHGPFARAELGGRYRVDAARAARARTCGRAGARRASPRGHRARVVRSRGPEEAATGVARVASQGGRAGRATHARPAAAGVAGSRRRAAGRRRRRPAARGPGAAAGRGTRARGLGARRAPAQGRRVLAGLDGRAVLGRRGGLDRGGGARTHVGAGGILLPRRRALARAAPDEAEPPSEPVHGAATAAPARGVLLDRPARRHRRGRRAGGGPGGAAGGALGPGVGGRGHE